MGSLLNDQNLVAKNVRIERRSRNRGPSSVALVFKEENAFMEIISSEAQKPATATDTTLFKEAC